MESPESFRGTEYPTPSLTQAHQELIDTRRAFIDRPSDDTRRNLIRDEAQYLDAVICRFVPQVDSLDPALLKHKLQEAAADRLLSLCEDVSPRTFRERYSRLAGVTEDRASKIMEEANLSERHWRWIGEAERSGAIKSLCMGILLAQLAEENVLLEQRAHALVSY